MCDCPQWTDGRHPLRARWGLIASLYRIHTEIVEGSYQMTELGQDRQLATIALPTLLISSILMVTIIVLVVGMTG